MFGLLVKVVGSFAGNAGLLLHGYCSILHWLLLSIITNTLLHHYCDIIATLLHHYYIVIQMGNHVVGVSWYFLTTLQPSR